MGTVEEKAERARALVVLQKMQELERQFTKERKRIRSPTVKGVRIRFVEEKKS